MSTPNTTTAPKTLTTADGSRITVTRTVCHVHLAVTGGPAVITAAAARDLAAALTRLADSVDPDGAAGDARPDALAAVLELHKCITYPDDGIGEPTACSHCDNEPWPCPTVRAATIGREARP